MLGIGGVGMAGLAALLLRDGWSVSGCDLSSGALVEWLGGLGVEVLQGHDPLHLSGGEKPAVIISAAVNRGEPELQSALSQGLQVATRGEVLAALCAGRSSIAVCGTHGKTTTSSFAARMLQELGGDPAWCIGGTTARLGSVAGGGNGALVVEADESDGSLALYYPELCVVTNIDLDHLEHFADEGELVACFARVVEQSWGGVVLCHDDTRVMSLASRSRVPLVTFGFGLGADLRAEKLVAGAESSEFDLVYKGQVERVRVGVAGRHNILNALGAAGAALLMGYEFSEVARALERGCGELPGRRFERILSRGGVEVVTDYAHHPVELRAMVEMAQGLAPKRLRVVFQPHRYSRTRALAAEFPRSLQGVDEVVLLPVFAASESVLPGGESADLYQRFREAGGGGRVVLARSRKEAWEYLRGSVAEGDLIVLAGAGDIGVVAEWVLRESEQGWPGQSVSECSFGDRVSALEGVVVEEYGELAGWSAYRSGGVARWRIEVESVEGLAAVLELCYKQGVRWRMTGGGFNTWFSDLGESGCVIRWARGAMCGLEYRGDLVEAGCGWSGLALLERVAAAGYGGLEFMEGIPGTLGGWLAMNAGIPGAEIGELVDWIRCLNPDGSFSILSGEEIGFVYRHCRGLSGRVALSCGLRLRRGSCGEEIKVARQGARERRLPLAGLRCAGSLFRNPEGMAAGRALESAGCMGLRVGGAAVSDFHANIVVTEDGSTSSDVLALMQQMRSRVSREYGVILEPEVRGLS